MPLCAILKTFGWKTVLLISNQLFTFLLIRTKGHVEKLKNYIDKHHKNIKFTSEIEENDLPSFLDITISCENNKFVTSVSCKPTFSGVFTNFESFIPDIQKRGLIETLLHRSFRLCSNYKNFHREIETLKSILKHNNYPQNFVNEYIKNVLNKLFIKKKSLISCFLKRN